MLRVFRRITGSILPVHLAGLSVGVLVGVLAVFVIGPLPTLVLAVALLGAYLATARVREKRARARADRASVAAYAQGRKALKRAGRHA